MRVLIGLLILAPTLLRAAEPQWHEVRSPHFTVLTDTNEKRGREVALRFEQVRTAFGILFPKARIDSMLPITVMAFRNKKEIREVSPRFNGKPVELAGFFHRGQYEAFVALDMSSLDPWGVVFHEYAHALLNTLDAPMPLWFEEGFAEYFSTISILKEKFEIGSVPESVPYILRNSRMMPMAQLLAVEHKSRDYNEGDRRSVFYAQSWLAVHYLWLDPGRRERLMRYLELRDKNVAIPQAVTQAFGLELKQLDKDLDKYFRTGQAKIYTIVSAAVSRPVTMSARPAETIEASACIGMMHTLSEDRWSEGLNLLEQVVQQKPNNLLALRGAALGYLRKGDEAKATSYLRRVIALKPQQADIYFLTAVLLQRMAGFNDDGVRAEMRSALERAVALDDKLADAHVALGLVYNSERDSTRAIAELQKAVSISPKDEYLFNLAIAYSAADRWDDAEDICNRVKNSKNERLASQAAQMLISLKEMKLYQERKRAGMAEYERDQAEADRYHSDDGDAANAPATKREDSAAAEKSVQTAKVASGAISSTAGKLLAVKCTATDVIFTIATTKSPLVLAGKLDELSVLGVALNNPRSVCEWKDRRIRVTYQKRSDGALEPIAVEPR